MVIGGTVIGAFLGLLMAELTRPIVRRRPRLIVNGAVGGLLAGFVYGVLSLSEAPCDFGSCGWVFLDRWFAYPWMPIALWTVLGGVVGAVLGSASAGLVRERTRKPAPTPPD